MLPRTKVLERPRCSIIALSNGVVVDSYPIPNHLKVVYSVKSFSYVRHVGVDPQSFHFTETLHVAHLRARAPQGNEIFGILETMMIIIMMMIMLMIMIMMIRIMISE